MTKKRIFLDFYGTVHSKKNSKVIRYNRRTGQRFISSNSTAKQNEADMIFQFREQISKMRNYKMDKVVPCGVNIMIWEPDRKRRDLDNQITAILDAMVRAGVIPDDDTRTVRAICASVDGVDSDNPRVRILITKLEGEEK